MLLWHVECERKNSKKMVFFVQSQLITLKVIV